MSKEEPDYLSINEAIAQAVYEQGWVVVDDYLPEVLRSQLLGEQQELLSEGSFRHAGIGKGESFTIKPEIRSDRVLWMDERALSPVQERYWSLMERLRQAINRRCFLGLRSFECHFAVYPPGSFYKRHLDQFQAVKYRVVTVILYLNEEWEESFGGELRMYLPSSDKEERLVDVLPKGGRLVVFLSGEIPHEVLPTTQDRASITGWFRDVADVS
ncbi:oxidoreductase, 2OG-Fe(II) oxygenase family [Lunatimonas lonarensis]|uniref:Oxidoreductase, 2OG-Fe(II) oxygenase family n=1 Tax=Lunatimonas lonarensis TaxID=1232681 RepID=R7ZPS1_9BACT|nr:2OG-Fe(II) oxygenase [Lunatimonas lonarensis]EON76090.1 oxidoreductase, 2OG-Fe(II) oxygenase family [Lunatimonas lonarensis]